MLESTNGIVVRNYTSNFDVKEFISNVLVPKAYPNIPIAKLNLGFTGIVSDYIGQAVEDAAGTASLMMNEAFITRAILPNSIYSEAAQYDLGYTFATPSRCNFALQLWLEDIIKYATPVSNSTSYRYMLDRDTKIIIGDSAYKLDYDIYIDFQYIDGNRVFSIYYNIDETNSISRVTSKYIKHQVSSIGWLVLFMELQEFERKVDTIPITDNLVTVNSDKKIKWTRQIAGLDLIYVTPQGDRLPMKLKHQYTKAEIDPFAWYRFYDDNTIYLSFSNSKGYFAPEFNSTIEYTVYTCRGEAANFDEYNRETGLPVQKTGNKYSYNANTKMVALCYGSSIGGLDKGDFELLRQDVINARNTANVLTSDHDLDLWFERYAQRYDTKSKFFKRRDDPTGTLFSQFIAIKDGSYIYPTNTLSITVDHNQFDYINTDASGNEQEFIIKPGHLWEYDDKDGQICRDRVRMVNGTDATAMVTDDALPQITSSRPFMFVNPFYIKIFRDPMISTAYNCLINETSWPEDVPIHTESFYQFQLATLSIERSLSSKENDVYKIRVICVPVVTTDSKMKYIEGIGDEYPKQYNNLRMVLITRNSAEGETGYIEMDPVELRVGNSIMFETKLYVHDNVTSDMMIEIDTDKTPIKALLSTGVNTGKIKIDANETSFHFVCMMKDETKNSSPLYGDDSFKGYIMANRFANVHRDLTLYKPMNMMRSTIEFEGSNGDYTITASLVPFLRYDIPLNDQKMIHFITAFSEQYRAMEPVLDRLEGNCTLDFKLYNTYGRSNNYYIGPKDGEDVLMNSDILLDNVYTRIRFRMSVHDRSLWYQTCEAVKTQITDYFESLDNNEINGIHVSELIHLIIQNNPNVNYIRFLGFNDYDANKQSIFVKYSDISELREDQLRPYVPEMIRVDSSSIEITEEV